MDMSSEKVGETCIEYQVMFMNNHSLPCWVETTVHALELSKELESLAQISLWGAFVIHFWGIGRTVIYG
ncbi:MAG: hypothetical protein RBR42_01750 [Desulfomicrobium sp.]|nr:hypothetical protein [Desulfomicrobium sp.]